VILYFNFPSTRDRVGGVIMLYEFANAMGRRGHDVHFIHGPAWEGRVDRVDQIDFDFDPSVTHHIVDTLDDPSLPDGDVLFRAGPARLGEPAGFVQGFRLTGPVMDRAAFHVRGPKVCIASWLVDVGRSFGVPEKQLVHIPLGLDHEIFSLRTPAPPRDIDVAMLYHPFGEKGWDVGRKVLEELTTRQPGLRVVVISMAGAPPEPLPEGVELKLKLDQRELADVVYNRTRVMVQFSHHEGFGLTAVEAMACGAALVTTDCGGSRDYAVPDETALVVPAGDVLGLVESVDALLHDDARRAALAAAGERFVRVFDWDRSAELLEEFLERYLKDPAAFQLPPGEDRSAEFSL
jgi:glycosyltransferase involved in cell wall biosynthesis